MKTINKIFPIFLIIILMSCSISVAESQTAEVRTFQNVQGVNLLGSGNVDIVIGDKEEVTIHAPEELIPYLVTEVHDGTLLLGKRKKAWKNFKFINEKIKYNVILKNLDHVKVSGSGNINAERLAGEECYVKVSGSGNVDVGSIDTDDLIVKVSGSGNIDLLSVSADDVDVTISGSGNVDLTGVINELDLTVSGSGNFDGTKMKCDDASIDIHGSGNAKLGIVKDELNAHISGSGDVYYGGNPRINTHSSGSGKIKHRKM